MKVKTKSIIHDHILDNYDHQHLESGKVYKVIEIDYESYRVIDEAGEPILYPKYLFIVIDSCIPPSWTRNDYDDEEYFIGPPELNKPGFYEDFFDGKPDAVSLFKKILIREGFSST